MRNCLVRPAQKVAHVMASAFVDLNCAGKAEEYVTAIKSILQSNDIESINDLVRRMFHESEKLVAASC